MKKLTFTVCALMAAAVCTAETNDQELVKFGSKMVTREYRRDVVRRALLSRSGGHVRKANSAKGWFVVVNAQKTVAQDEIVKSVATIDRQIHIQTKVVAGSGVSAANAKEKISSAGGALGVVVIDEGTSPALLCAPEEGWAVVNVAKLAADKPKPDVLATRVRREVLRGFSYVAGDMSATYGETLMQPIVKPQDLDLIAREEFAVALLNTFPTTLPRYGIDPWYQRTYVKACEEGWAPAPTNKYQQAIWDKVHAVPQKPMKIEFDAKKGR